MAREQYGNTWWGEQWLASLSRIDHSNRIPRGVSYARRGMVDEIIIKDATILTKVKGSRPKPYKVTLSMGQLAITRVNTMLDKVMEYPTIISRLMNGKMDPKLLEVALESGVKIFPSSSRDMDMNCSCPDWAVPCKHLAASIYKVCSDIDNNPFVLFEFRGIDLPAMLTARDINIYDIQNQMVASLESYFKNHEYKSSDNTKLNLLPTLDFSKIRDREKELMSLLEEQPSFYTTGNFRKAYDTQLRKVAKIAQRIVDEKVDLSIYYSEKLADKSYEAISIGLTNGKLDSDGFNLGSLLSYEKKDLELSPFSTSYYHQLLKLALHCLANGLVTPTLLEKTDNRYVIFWEPAKLDDTIREIIEAHSDLQGITLDNGKRGNTFISLSILTTDLIHRFSKDVNAFDDRFLALFYKGIEGSFDGLSESSIPNSISRWLRLFNFDLGDYFPVIKVEERNDKFYIDIQIGQKGGDMAAPQEFSVFVNSIKDKSFLFDFYKDLDLLSQYMPRIGDYINTKGSDGLVYTAYELPEFLFHIQPTMKLLGIKVVLPKSLKHLIRPKKSVSLDASSGESSGLLGLANMLSFDWKVSLGKNVVSVQEFKDLVTRADTLIKYKSQYIYIDAADFAQLEKELSKSSNLSNIELLSIALAEEFNGSTILLSQDVKSLIKSLTSFDTIDQPKSLKATFRPYQLRGYSWLVKNVKIGVGSIIADDMGLGKTLQVIALITYLVEDKKLNDKRKAIIIVPTSLIPNWEAEFNKFAPDIKPFTYYGPNRDVDDLTGQKVIITSYGNVRSDVAKLKKHKWAISVIDEAQNIKNPAAQQTKSIKSLKADNNIAMSGTPVENRLLDYWSVMDYVNKGLLGNRTSFSKTFDKPISKEHNQDVLAIFKKITSPFIMRRMKTDKSIISDLPDKIMNDTYASLTPKQSALYQKVVNEALALIQQEGQKEDTSLFKQKGMVLQMILALKQICNHPSQWLKDGINNVEDSGKLQLLVDTMSSVIEAGDKALIFTQFKGMGDIIEETLDQKMGIKPLWLHGGVSMKNRKRMVEEFQNQSHQKVMILSLKAGGTGLNLTAANHVIHYDLWWNPAVEAQATDRAFRIGQNKNVFVHRFITQHTFEEKINDLINSKKALADLTVTSGENWIGELSGKELEEVFKLGV